MSEYADDHEHLTAAVRLHALSAECARLHGLFQEALHSGSTSADRLGRELAQAHRAFDLAWTCRQIDTRKMPAAPGPCDCAGAPAGHLAGSAPSCSGGKIMVTSPEVPEIDAAIGAVSGEMGMTRLHAEDGPARIVGRVVTEIGIERISHLTLQEIADEGRRLTGVMLTRSSVRRQMEALGIDRRIALLRQLPDPEGEQP